MNQCALSKPSDNSRDFVLLCFRDSPVNQFNCKLSALFGINIDVLSANYIVGSMCLPIPVLSLLGEKLTATALLRSTCSRARELCGVVFIMSSAKTSFFELSSVEITNRPS